MTIPKRFPTIKLAPRLLVTTGTITAMAALLILTRYYGLHQVVAELKSWQTLLAAMTAVGAALIAYQASLLKVSLDRSIADRDMRRIKLGLYLRLQLALGSLHLETQTVKGLLEYTGSEKTVTREELVFSEPDEIKEAWTNLDLFPVDAIDAISRIRHIIRWIQEELHRVGDRIFTYKFTPSELTKYEKAVIDLRKAIENIRPMLSSEISAMHTKETV